MDYSDDCCMDRFTPMQAEKMKYSWKLFREDYYAVKADDSTVPVSTTTSTDTGGNASYTTAATSNPSSINSVSDAGLQTHFGFFSVAFLVLLLAIFIASI